MTRMIYPLYLAVALLLAGCAAQLGLAQSPAQKVYAMHGSSAPGWEEAPQYRNLPPCAPGAPTMRVCSDPKVQKERDQADDLAFAALQRAQFLVGRTPPAPASTVDGGGGRVHPD